MGAELNIKLLKDRVGFAVLMLVYGVLVGVVVMLAVGVITSDEYPDDKLVVYTQGLEISTESIEELMQVVEKHGGTVDEVSWNSVGSDTIRIRFANWKRDEEK